MKTTTKTRLSDCPSCGMTIVIPVTIIAKRCDACLDQEKWAKEDKRQKQFLADHKQWVADHKEEIALVTQQREFRRRRNLLLNSLGYPGW